MPLDRAIANLRQLHGFGMKSEAELRRVVLAVLEGVRDPSAGTIDAVGRAICVYPNAKWDDPHVQADDGGFRTATVNVAVTTWEAALDHLIREASGDGVG